MEDRVKAPGIGLMVAGILSAMFNLLSIGMNVLSIGAGAAGAGTGDEAMMSMFSGTIGLVVAVIGLGWNGYIAFSGWKMQQLESYGMVLAGAIMAAIPCFGCCLWNMPIGIWAIIVLQDANVKASFRG